MMSRRQTVLFAVACAAALVAINIASPRLNPYFMHLVIFTAVNVILAVSLNLISGFTGQLNLGHAGFMAVGAYLSAGLTFHFGGKVQAALGGIGIPAWLAGDAVFLVALSLGGVAAAVSGLLVGLPTLRLRGDYLAIATLGFGEIIRVIIVQLEVVGAARGLVGIPRYTTFLWAAGWAAITIIVVRNLMTSAHGRALTSVREDEMAAQVMGVDTVRYKVVAFTTGAFFAGIAGALLAHHMMYLNPAMFSFLRSIEIVLMVVLGGMGSIAGSAAGAVILTFLPEALRTLAGVLAVAYAGGWAVLLLPCLRAPGRPRWLAVGALALAGATVLGVLLAAVELGAEGGGAPLAWLGAGALGLGLWAMFAAGRVNVARALAGAAAGAVFCVVFAWPQILPPSVVAARDWLGSNVSQLRMVIYSILLVLLMLVRPQGLFGRAELTWQALRAILPTVKRRAATRAR